MYNFFFKIFFLKNSPRSLNTSLIFPVLAVILASLAFILIFSSMNSLERHFIDKIKDINGNSNIYIEYKNNDDFSMKFKEIRNFLLKSNKNSYRRIEQTALIKYYDSYKIVNVIGLDNLYTKKIKLGLQYNLSDLKDKILIGDDLHYFLEIDKNLDDELTILAPLDSEIITKQRKFNIHSENFVFNNVTAIDKISENIVFINYLDALELFSQAKSFISIDKDLTQSEINSLNNEFEIEKFSTWHEKYPIFFASIKLEKILYSVFGIILIFVAAFNIYGNINLILYRKRKQFASLNFMGMSPHDLKKIFNFNLFLIGFFGSFFGVGLSYLIVNLNIIQNFLPLAVNIEIEAFIIPFVIFFNIIILYLSAFFAIKKNMENIRSLKTNAIKY